jgi:hypothetical protein
MMGLVALLFATGAVAQEMRIQFAEKVTIAAAPGHTEFDAYGRRFSLELENNSRLLAALPAAQKSNIPVSQLLRGKLEGVPGSWVRLARVGGGLEGAIWDGSDLYVVTRHSSIAPHLVQPVTAGLSDTVVYRLSDAQNVLPEKFCGLARNLPQSKVDRSALKIYQTMVADLRVNAALISPTDQLQIALISDREFQSQFGAAARDTMLARLNTVDGIFSEQVGVLLLPSAVRLVPAAGNPFTTSNAEQLLDQVSAYRRADQEIRSAGLAHLMTGKVLNDFIAGIAFIDSLCEVDEGVSLSDSSVNEFAAALVMAHELGHNFGARHDGVPGSGCEAVTGFYIMDPQTNSSMEFSQCSLDAMRPKIALARGRCIAPATYSDAGLALPASPFEVDTREVFTLPVTINSTGTLPAQNSTLHLELPSQLAFQSATVTNGTCTSTGNAVDCTLGDIPAGEQRSVALRLLGTERGTYTVSGTVASSNDRFASNNSASVQVGLRLAVDLAVTVTPGAESVFETDAVDFVVDVTSTRTQLAQGAGLVLYTYGFLVESIDTGAHSCTRVTAGFDGYICQLADIAPGESTRIVIHARASLVGSYGVSANFNNWTDGDFANNYSVGRVTVKAEREIRTTTSTDYLRAVIGVAYEVTFTVTVGGRLPIENVRQTVEAPGVWPGVIESVVANGGTCGTPNYPTTTECAFGTLNPGDVRTVVVRLRTPSEGSSSISGYTIYSDGVGDDYNFRYFWVYSDQRLDAEASISSYRYVDEGQTGTLSVFVRSAGIDPIQDVVATVTVPLPVRLTNVYVNDAPPGFLCSIETPQSLRCTGSFTATRPGANVTVTFVSDTEMTGVATLAVTGTGDGDTGNDIAQAPLEVRPPTDVGLIAPSSDLFVMAGDLVTLEMTLTTSRSPIQSVIFWADSAFDLMLESVRVNGIDCQLPPIQAGSRVYCPGGSLPANSSVPVVLRYRASQRDASGTVYLYAEAFGDSNSGNNSVTVSYAVGVPTDVSLSALSNAISGQSGMNLGFPRIVVSGTTAIPRNVVVNIPIPPFASVQSLTTSSGGICTGTTTLQCTFSPSPFGGAQIIDITLRAQSAGTFTSNITMTAGNDNTPDNNAASVATTVTDPPPPPNNGGSSSGGAKKGGGSLEWLALAFLGLLVGVRWAFGELAPQRRQRPH